MIMRKIGTCTNELDDEVDQAVRDPVIHARRQRSRWSLPNKQI